MVSQRELCRELGRGLRAERVHAHAAEEQLGLRRRWWLALIVALVATAALLVFMIASLIFTPNHGPALEEGGAAPVGSTAPVTSEGQ